MRIFASLILLKIVNSARIRRKADKPPLSTSAGKTACQEEQYQCTEVTLDPAESPWQAETIKQPTNDWTSERTAECSKAAKCVLCLIDECSYTDEFVFYLSDDLTDIGNCSALSRKDPRFHISGENGTCDQCGTKYQLEVVNHTFILDPDFVERSSQCRLRGRHNGAIITYGIGSVERCLDNTDCNPILYVESPGTKDFLSIEVDVQVYIALMISFAAALVGAIFCLFSHTPFMIENLICHKNFSCYRWSNWICACCPRDFLASSCNSCKKKVSPKNTRYTRLDSGRSRVGSNRSRFDSVRSTSKPPPHPNKPPRVSVRFQYDDVPGSQSSYQNFNV